MAGRESPRHVPKKAPKSPRVSPVEPTSAPSAVPVTQRRGGISGKVALVLGLFAAAGAGTAVVLSQGSKTSAPTQSAATSSGLEPLRGPSMSEQLDSNSRHAERYESPTDAMIAKLEPAWLQLEHAWRPKVEAHPDPKRREELALPFLILRSNVDNPEKNGIRTQRLGREAGRERQNTEPNFFYYEVSDLAPGVAAAWAGSTRTMTLSTKFDPSNIVHMTVLYHEMVHVGQDNAIRSGIQTAEQRDKYLAFNTTPKGGRSKTVINLEATAYANEIDLLDIISNKLLSRLILNGQPVPLGELAHSIGASSDDEKSINILTFIVSLAQQYYLNGGMKDGNLPPQFFEFLAQSLIDRGYDPYIFSSNGGVKPYRPGQK